MAMCLPLLMLLMTPMARGFPVIHAQGSTGWGGTSVITDYQSTASNNYLILNVVFLEPTLLAGSKPQIPSGQQFVIPPDFIHWDSSPDVWDWCEDIFTAGGDAFLYSPGEKLGFQKVTFPNDRYAVIVGTTGSNAVFWRSIRKCSSPQCVGCYYNLGYFVYTLVLSDDHTLMAYGRCKGYQQIECDTDNQCTNGQSVSSLKSKDPDTWFQLFRSKCIPCSPGTWNTCTEAVDSTLHTCSW